MRDTEPMVAVVPPVPPAPRRFPFVSTSLALVAAIALALCAYLHGEVVALRAEVHESRVAVRAALAAADRASLEAQNARSALAAAETPEPEGPFATPPPTDPDENQ